MDIIMSLRIEDLRKKYPFFKRPEESGFKLSLEDEKYIEQKKPFLLFFNGFSDVLRSLQKRGPSSLALKVL